MRVKKSAGSGILEGDLTPMIDMTFQLIAFFMVLINFNQSEQHEKIQLPDSELAKPEAQKTDYPIILHLTQRDPESGQPETVILGGQEIAIEALGPFLGREKAMYEGQGAKDSEITVVIRAHKGARTGKVQNLIAKCQDSGLENFKLRAKEDVGNYP
jgi:biopolymer transport protein ExbD